MKTPKKEPDWERLATRRLKRIVAQARDLPTLRKRGPRPDWVASVELVGLRRMTTLNGRYRAKTGPTDVLSFHPPEIFRLQGQLGELVICLPVLKRQAREQGHVPKKELEILLVHGVLHLLGLDHDLGPAEARRMARLETELLARIQPNVAKAGLKGLIRRGE